MKPPADRRVSPFYHARQAGKPFHPVMDQAILSGDPGQESDRKAVLGFRNGFGEDYLN